MIIPHTSLSSDTLDAIIQEFVTREGTDYGMVSYSLESKVRSVRTQLDAGKAVVVFDPQSETCDIIVKGTARYRDATLAGLTSTTEEA
jgi:uncharacterized protein YheU (UPF0270 family)